MYMQFNNLKKNLNKANTEPDYANQIEAIFEPLLDLFVTAR